MVDSLHCLWACQGRSIMAWGTGYHKVAHFVAAEKQERWGWGGGCVHSSSVFMQPILQVSMASLLCASFFIYWTHGVHRIQGRAFIEYCSIVFIKLRRRIILFHFTVERNNIEEGWIICPGSLVSQVVKAGVESRSCRLLKPSFIQLLSTLPRPSPFSYQPKVMFIALFKLTRFDSVHLKFVRSVNAHWIPAICWAPCWPGDTEPHRKPEGQ